MRLGVLLVVSLLGACFTVRASVGPHVSSSGRAGVTAVGGYGLGWSFDHHQAVYVAATGGISADDHARALLIDNFDYVNAEAGMPVRITARLGAMFGRERYREGDRALFGVGVAVFPWHGDVHGEHERSEKGWTDFGPDLSTPGGIGVEVAMDVLPGTAATPTTSAERTAMMVTVGLVAELDGMLDR